MIHNCQGVAGTQPDRLFWYKFYEVEEKNEGYRPRRFPCRHCPAQGPLGIVDRDPDVMWAEAVARKACKLERLAQLAEAGVCTDISGLDRFERRRLLWGVDIR